VASATSVRCSPSTSWLLDSAATYQQTHGQPGTARPLLEWALHLNEAAYGPGHPHVANALSKLARALVDLDEPVTARSLLERALRIDETATDPTIKHPSASGRHCDSSMTRPTECAR